MAIEVSRAEVDHGGRLPLEALCGPCKLPGTTTLQMREGHSSGNGMVHEGRVQGAELSRRGFGRIREMTRVARPGKCLRKLTPGRRLQAGQMDSVHGVVRQDDKAMA